MPYINFDKVEGIEKESLELLHSDVVQKAIEAGANNYISVATQDAEKRVQAKEAKLKAANEKLAEFGGIDPETAKTLQASAKGKEELEATLKAIQDKYDTAEQELKQKADMLQKMQLEHTINATISKFNTENPDINVRDDARDFVFMLASQSFKDADGKLIPHNADGSPMATDKGYATPADWLHKLRSEKPLLFNAPSGSGATGSKSSGSAGKDNRTSTQKIADGLRNL